MPINFMLMNKGNWSYTNLMSKEFDVILTVHRR